MVRPRSCYGHLVSPLLTNDFDLPQVKALAQELVIYHSGLHTTIINPRFLMPAVLTAEDKLALGNLVRRSKNPSTHV